MNIDEAKKLISQEVFGMFKGTAVVVSAKESIDLVNAIEALIDAKIKEAIQPIQCAALGHDFNKNSFAEEIGKCKRCDYDSGR